jgi:hypothetical protein
MYPEAHRQIIIVQSKWSERTWNLMQNAISSSHQFIRTSFRAAIYSLAFLLGMPATSYLGRM